MTLNQKLTQLGYQAKPAGNSKKHIIKDGVIVFTGTSFEVTEWLNAK